MEIQTTDMFILGLRKEQNNTKERKAIWWQKAVWHLLASKTCKSSANTVISDEWQVMHKFMFIQRKIAAILSRPKKRKKCTQTPAYHTFRNKQGIPWGSWPLLLARPTSPRWWVCTDEHLPLLPVFNTFHCLANITSSFLYHHHHHHFWLALLRVRSATGCQQPPEWSVLGQVNCVGPWQLAGVEVVLHRLHPGHPRSSLPIHRRRGSQDLLCILHCRSFRRYAQIGLDAVPG